ncbi:MAG: peptide deformylase [Burkholderiaceae bacterium]|jgi:peptide deformylase|nr:peptide deformylase [Burkholderiaceae bacterium]
MSVRPILKMGDPRLLRPSKPVTRLGTPELEALIQDMFDTMAAADGAGLAAPQIGVPLRLVIFGFDTPSGAPEEIAVPRTILLNPVLTPLGEEQEEGWEGCLSLPGMRGVVSRWAKIRYEGTDQYGNPVNRVASHFHSRVVQHECDHLQGILYPMRMHDMSLFGYIDAMKETAEAFESTDDSRRAD